jgi:hypothetical protein
MQSNDHLAVDSFWLKMGSCNNKIACDIADDTMLIRISCFMWV